MKNYLILSFLLVILTIHSIEKPVIRTGINSDGNFNIMDENDSLYPSSLIDNLLFSINESFSDVFRMTWRLDFFYYTYNKYSENLEGLKAIVLKNSLTMYFNMNRQNEIQLYTRPVYYYRRGEAYAGFLNRIQYKYYLKNFIFKIRYSHLFETREESIFCHNAYFCFYWYFPKYEFVKYKTSLSVYFQHYTYIKDAGLSPLKNARFKFEVIFNLNKLSLDDTFDAIEGYEDEFYDE